MEKPDTKSNVITGNHVVGLPLMSGNPKGRATSFGLSSSFTPRTLFNQSGVLCLPFLVIPGMSCRGTHYFTTNAQHTAHLNGQSRSQAWLTKHHMVLVMKAYHDEYIDNVTRSN